MARIGFTGFAINDPSTGGNLDGLNTCVRESVTIRNGMFSAKADSGAGNSAKNCGGAGGVGLISASGAGVTRVGFGRAYFYFSNLPGVTTTIARVAVQSGTSALNADIKMDSTGHLIASVGSTSSSASVLALVTGRWYRIEYQATIVINAGNTQIDITLNDILVDGTSAAISATSNSVAGTIGGTIAGTFGWVTAPGANLVCYISDAALNDNQGVNQNTYPGSGMCVLLVPTATSAAAAKWLDNDGTQTNMWQGAANTPPAGIAAATSPSHAYIKHTGGAAGTTDAFDATMKTYLAAGIKQVDAVNVIQYYIVTGEESGTGTKLLAVAGVSNPVVAQSSSFDVFAASGAQGIYASNWSLWKDRLPFQYAPSVTVGTAPVYRVVRPETASRVASVCFMGMYVDYTPAVVSLLKPMRAAVLGV